MVRCVLAALLICASSLTTAFGQDKCYFLECAPPPSMPTPPVQQAPAPVPAPTHPPSEPGQGFVLHQGIDFPGNDLLWLTEQTLATCGEACQANPRCAAFTLNTEKRVCILKHSVGARAVYAGAMSGVMERASPQTPVVRPTGTRINVKSQTDFRGGDYRDFRYVSHESCQATCVRDSSCVGYTYVVSKNWCWLKSRLTEASYNDDAVSGTKY